ncbi:MAG: asparagine synthetase B [Candidatus Zixiibacteriota bacterium]|nr:MAG: asparagine synthetase B [candidate division Zixibacteria bacterium]
MLLFALLFTLAPAASAQSLLVPMDLEQSNHLKAYGVAYWVLEQGVNVEWLLNYRSGSFMVPATPALERVCRLRGVTYEVISAGDAAAIYGEIESANMERVMLEKAPKVAVYVPPNFQPWDDAVTLALEYAEIPYDKVFDEEVLSGKLLQYDWLHLHHEDFTGQYGKFYALYRGAKWYVEQQAVYEELARKLGYRTVQEEKKAVAAAIKDYVGQGGFMFAMCSATDSYDIALAAQGVDICAAVFDGTPADPEAQQKLDFSQTFAFENFSLIPDPLVYEFSDIDTTPRTGMSPRGDMLDYFTLFEFSAKYDPVPTMLTQDHTSVVKGFMGQTTAFKKSLVKKGITIMGQVEGSDEVKYLHGDYGKGTFTYYGGHDPEDYRHQVGDPPTQLDLYPNSPGYRLILNNVLFPAARKKEQKT